MNVRAILKRIVPLTIAVTMTILSCGKEEPLPATSRRPRRNLLSPRRRFLSHRRRGRFPSMSIPRRRRILPKPTISTSAGKPSSRSVGRRFLPRRVVSTASLIPAPRLARRPPTGVRADRVEHVSRRLHGDAEQWRRSGSVVHAGRHDLQRLHADREQSHRARFPADVHRWIVVSERHHRPRLHQPGHEQSSRRSKGLVHAHRHEDQSVGIQLHPPERLLSRRQSVGRV